VATPHYCHSEPFAVILSPSLVILSGAKNLALSIFTAVPGSSSPTVPRNDRRFELSGTRRKPVDPGHGQE